MGAAAGATVSGVKLADWPVAGAEGVKLKLVPAATVADVSAAEGCAASRVARSEGAAAVRPWFDAVAVGCAAVVAAVEGAGCRVGVAGVSARRVTVPLIEKSRSWAGPTASCVAAGGGGAIEIGALSEGAPSS